MTPVGVAPSKITPYGGAGYEEFTIDDSNLDYTMSDIGVPFSRRFNTSGLMYSPNY
jgi:outer membrane protein W